MSDKNDEKITEEISLSEKRHKSFGKRLKDASWRSFLLLGILLIFVAKIVFDFNGFGTFVSQAINLVFDALSYLVFGFILAYILNAYMMWLERRPLRGIRNSRRRRRISILISYITLAAFVVLLIFLIVPKLIDSITSLAKMVPNLYDKIYGFYQDIIDGGKFNLPDAVKDAIVEGLARTKDALLGMLDANRIMLLSKNILTATGKGIFYGAMGILVSVYMLLEKDDAVHAAKRIVNGMLKPAQAAKVFDAGGKINAIFKRYFTGKLLQCIVILFVSYITLMIGRIEYAILFAVILSFTNMIPYIGPWIGGIPTVLICLVQDPLMGVRALICVLVIQLLDNWFITPNVVGGQIGISPLLVLIGLCIGGTMFGFFGMIIGDVLAAIVKVFFYDTFIAKRIHKKVLDGEINETDAAPLPAKEGPPAWIVNACGKIKKFFTTKIGKKSKKDDKSEK